MNPDYAAHYARFHPDTPEHDAHLRVLLARWLGPHLPVAKEAAILDVGCGRGYAVAWLQELGYAATTGIDTDLGQVEFGRARGWPVQHVVDTIAFLRARPSQHAVVLLMDVLEHVPRSIQIEFLEAVRATLIPGGKLLCTVPNAAAGIASYWHRNDYTHTSTFTDVSLHYALVASGWSVDAIEEVEFFVRPRFLFWLPTRRALQWWLLRLERLRARFAYWAELGFEHGGKVPLSLNLLASARRPE
jgi:2-polyprenyl-3-methyl-5-hydroxy-6-metoxy-1,4-benzoquinol methylase